MDPNHGSNLGSQLVPNASVWLKCPVMTRLETAIPTN